MEFYGKVSNIAKIDKRLYQSHQSLRCKSENVVRIDKANHIVYLKTMNHAVSRLKLKGLDER